MEEFYDEIELEDMEESEDYFTYPCPCGDMFIITKTDIQHGEDIAYCPSCTLKIRVIY